MHNWFKLVATNKDQENWMIKELKEGKLHYGWSPRGSKFDNLNEMIRTELDNITLQLDEWRPKASEVLRKGYFLTQA